MNQQSSFLVVTAFVLAIPLTAQSGGFTAVQGSGKLGKVLSYQIQAQGPPTWIEFRNTGPERLHFRFRFKAFQSREDAIRTNGRISLGPNRSCRIPLPPGVDPLKAAASPVRVQDIHSGEGDQGEFEAEDPESGSDK